MADHKLMLPNLCPILIILRLCSEVKSKKTSNLYTFINFFILSQAQSGFYTYEEIEKVQSNTRPLNPPQRDFRTNQSLKSPLAEDLVGEIRLLEGIYQYSLQSEFFNASAIALYALRLSNVRKFLDETGAFKNSRLSEDESSRSIVTFSSRIPGWLTAFESRCSII